MIPASTGTRAVNINTVTCGDPRPHILLACAAGNFDIATQGLRVSTFRKSKLKICQVPGDQKAPKDVNVEMCILIFLHIHFHFLLLQQMPYCSCSWIKYQYNLFLNGAEAHSTHHNPLASRRPSAVALSRPSTNRFARRTAGGIEDLIWEQVHVEQFCGLVVLEIDVIF